MSTSAAPPAGPAPKVSLQADDRGLSLPGLLEARAAYDVLINGQHVWSFQPRRDAVAGRNGHRVEWPRALRKHLNGHAEIALREHVTGDTVATCERTFGPDSDREVSVVDSSGRPLVLDKWGRLTKPLSAEGGPVVDALMAEVVRLLDVLREECGVASYIVFGTLLGAVRDGRLIAYDNDVDIAYVSEHEYPVDIMLEGYRIQRILQQHGWNVRRGSGVRLNVRLRMRDKTMRFVDVFTSHWTNGNFFIPSDVGAPLPREAILPLGTLELMGWTVPAPADPPALLVATYGEGWEVPDPSFKYETPQWLKRRLAGWFGGHMKNRKHWDSFNSREARNLPDEPTSFARWVESTYPSSRPLVELGSGTGRDALHFARRGRHVFGVDYSWGAVWRAKKAAAAQEASARFQPVNLYDLRACLALGAWLAREDEPVDLYARFLLHALADRGRENLWRVASMSLRRGGRLFLEFRTTRDRRLYHVYDDHMRRYLNPPTVVAEIEAAGGRVVHCEEGRGLARFRDEDPHICRIVAEWGTPPD